MRKADKNKEKIEKPTVSKDESGHISMLPGVSIP